MDQNTPAKLPHIPVIYILHYQTSSALLTLFAMARHGRHVQHSRGSVRHIEIDNEFVTLWGRFHEL